MQPFRDVEGNYRTRDVRNVGQRVPNAAFGSGLESESTQLSLRPAHLTAPLKTDPRMKM